MEEELRAGNPLRCEFGIWRASEKTGKAEYRCKLDGIGLCRGRANLRLSKCDGYPDQVCERYERQPRPKPIPGYEDMVKDD